MNRALFRRLGVASGGALLLALAVPAAGAGSLSSSAPDGQATTVMDGRLVFNDYGTGQLYTSNPDGSALVQVTHLRASRAFYPEWSPDSSRIVFNAFPTGEMRLYTIKPDGTHRHLVTAESPGYNDWAPSYTPDGQRIVYARCAPDPPGGGCAIYSVRADGADRRAVTTYGHGIREAVDFRPQVSPDGHWVAFSRFNWKGIGLQIWLVRADGTDAHPVTPARLRAGDATWSTDSRTLYFQAGPPLGLGIHVFKTPVNGSHVTQLTFTDYPNGDFNPDSSPSGRRLAFISDRTHPDLCCQDLYTMNADGSNQQFADTGLSLPGQPDWGSAPLQNGPSADVPQLSAAQLQAGKTLATRAETPGLLLLSSRSG